ncbi:MAG: uracil-DNA glycosylase [Rhodoluna sp.]|nr:uracil-DNA glycosylase [Rhodoluna sp.]
MFFQAMHPTWQNWLAQYEPMLAQIEAQVLQEKDVVPELPLVMRAFETDPMKIKVVLIGQDPYPTRGDAIGLAFAIHKSRQIPRSLVNIAKELKSDLPQVAVNTDSPDLSNWSQQGVLLLNTALTTLEGQAGAHSKLGWEEFTYSALSELRLRNKLVLVLWGKSAITLGRKLASNSREGQIQLIESVHPSPLSAFRGFFGSKPFSRANGALLAMGLEPIDWSL